MCIFFGCTAKHFFNKISLYSTKNTWYIKDSYPVVASRYLCILILRWKNIMTSSRLDGIQSFLFSIFPDSNSDWVQT